MDMSFRLVIDGNAVYEIDEDCEKCKKRECCEERKQGQKEACRCYEKENEKRREPSS